MRAFPERTDALPSLAQRENAHRYFDFDPYEN
jgi:hypothetical protein